MRSTCAVLLLAMAALSCGRDGCSGSAENRQRADQAARDRWGEMRELGKRCDLQDQEPPDRGPCARACELGHSNSCYRLGRYNVDGVGVPVDRAGAIELFERACGGGSGLGCAALAGARQVAENDELWGRARNFSRVHCEQDHRESCLRLGELYRDGRGGPKDVAAAGYAFGRACSLGSQAACGAIDAGPAPETR